MGESIVTYNTAASDHKRIRAGFAWLLLIIGGLLLLGVIGMAFARRDVPIPDLPDSEPWYSGVFNALGTLSLLATGGFLAMRMPRNSLAWLMLLAGFGYALHLFAVGYTYISYLVTPLSFTALMFVLAAAGLALFLPAIPMIVLLFPSGRLPSPRWRIAYWIWIYFIIQFASVSWLSPAGKFVPFDNPLAQAGTIGQVVGILSVTAWFSFLGLLLAATVSAIVRGLRAEGQERQQFKWLGLAVSFTFITFIFAANPKSNIWLYVVSMLSTAAIPLAIALAVARYRLWDLDLVIRRTTSYAILTALLALIYFSSIVVLQQLLTPVTGKSDVVVVFSTLLIAGLFLPLRRRIQNTIDRRFFRNKYNAEKVLQEFAVTVRDETDLDALMGELARVIQETMQPEHVSVWLMPTVKNSE